MADLQTYTPRLTKLFELVHVEGKSIHAIFLEGLIPGMSRATYYALLKAFPDEIQAVEEEVIQAVEAQRRMEAAALTTARAETSMRLNRTLLEEADGILQEMISMIRGGESEIARARLFEIFWKLIAEGAMTPRERKIENDPAALPAAPAPHETWKPTPFANLAELAKAVDARGIVILGQDGSRTQYTPPEEPIEGETTPSES